MNPTIETVRVYQDELLREAEAERLVLEALAERHGESPLVWMGRQMIAFGNTLVELAGGKEDETEPRWTFSKN